MQIEGRGLIPVRCDCQDREDDIPLRVRNLDLRQAVLVLEAFIVENDYMPSVPMDDLEERFLLFESPLSLGWSERVPHRRHRIPRNRRDLLAVWNTQPYFCRNSSVGEHFT